MLLESIERVVESGMSLQTWEDSQSSGVWAVLGDDRDVINDIVTLSNSGLRENIWLKNLVYSDEDKILIVLAETFELALKILDTKIQSMPKQIFQKGSKERERLSEVYNALSTSV